MVKVQVGPPLKPLFLRGFLFFRTKNTSWVPYWVPFYLIFLIRVSVKADTLCVLSKSYRYRYQFTDFCSKKLGSIMAYILKILNHAAALYFYIIIYLL